MHLNLADNHSDHSREVQDFRYSVNLFIFWTTNLGFEWFGGRRCAPSLQGVLQVYRLVTEDSVEACLVDSPAIRLLPDSVFMTTSPASATTTQLLSARHCESTSRVQPNVVQELVTRLRKRALWRQQKRLAVVTDALIQVNWPDEDDELEDLDEGMTDDDSDTASLFQTREPLAESMVCCKDVIRV